MRLKAKDVIATILAAAIAVPYSWPGGGRVRSGRTWSLSGWGLSTVLFRLDCPLTYTEDRVVVLTQPWQRPLQFDSSANSCQPL
jgi:hypothetical protein